MLAGSIRVGIQAAKKTFMPAICVWAMMAAIAAAYYLFPASHHLFGGLITLQEQMGILFPSLGMGLSVGLLAESVRVLMSRARRWSRENTINALFNFGVFGVMGLTHYYRYAFQDDMFGTGASLQVLVPKVMFDQFVWTVLAANPYQAVLYLWKNSGFRWREVVAEMLPFRAFWGTKMLPVLITNWAFWIPMASLVYCFPSELQLPLSIFAVTIWVLLLSVLTSATRHE